VSAVRILLVEDSTEDVLFFKRAAAKAGLRCSLEVVENGQLAIDLLSADAAPKPTHVHLDLKMPLVSGLEVLAWIRSHPAVATLPVIILTSSQLASDSSRANELGVDAFLVKPVSSKALLEIVREIAGRWNIPVEIA
jgi:two-component system response regulator